MSFIYDMLETFCFPNDKTKIIYNSYEREKNDILSCSIGTYNTALCFIILCSEKNSIPDGRFCNIIFEVIVQNDIIKCFDSSNEFWERFYARAESLGKKLGYFEIESTNNPCQILIAVNPKEYYKHFEIFSSNKKRKGKRKGKSGMTFENFAAKIATSRQTNNSDAHENEYIKQSCFIIVGGEMQQSTI